MRDRRRRDDAERSRARDERHLLEEVEDLTQGDLMPSLADFSFPRRTMSGNWHFETFDYGEDPPDDAEEAVDDVAFLPSNVVLIMRSNEEDYGRVPSSVVIQELDDDDIALKKKQLEDAKKLKEAAAKASQKGPMGSESMLPSYWDHRNLSVRK